MGILVVGSFIRLFTYSHLAWGYGGRISVMLGLLGCGIALYRYHDLSLKELRLIEFLVLMFVGILAAVIEVRLMITLAQEPDVPTLISVNNWSYFVWSMLIMIYGVFMPNTWQRAAVVMLPVAMMPQLITTLPYGSNRKSKSCCKRMTMASRFPRRSWPPALQSMLHI